MTHLPAQPWDPQFDTSSLAGKRKDCGPSSVQAKLRSLQSPFTSIADHAPPPSKLVAVVFLVFVLGQSVPLGPCKHSAASPSPLRLASLSCISNFCWRKLKRPGNLRVVVTELAPAPAIPPTSHKPTSWWTQRSSAYRYPPSTAIHVLTSRRELLSKPRSELTYVQDKYSPSIYTSSRTDIDA